MRWVVLVPLALLVLTALAIFVGRRLKDAAVVVERAPYYEVSTCSGCNAYAAWGQHDPWCPYRPRVVAGSDVDPLERMFSAPAYGEER